MPAIIPTVDGRVGGSLRRSATQTYGLILLAGHAALTPTTERIFALLGVECQLASINVLEVSGGDRRARGDHPADNQPRDPVQLALDLLAAITHLRSQGVLQIAVVFSSSDATPLSLDDLQAQLLARCIAACQRPSAADDEIAQQLSALTDSIRGAMDSIHGVAYLYEQHEERTQPRERMADDTASYFMVAPDSEDKAEETGETQRVARALYDWISQTFFGKTMETIEQQEPPTSRTLQMDIRQTHATMRHNLAYLQAQWSLLLADLEKRDALRAQAIQARIAHEDMISNSDSPTAALRAARLAWQLLDAPARRWWIEAWEQTFRSAGQILMRQYR